MSWAYLSGSVFCVLSPCSIDLSDFPLPDDPILTIVAVHSSLDSWTDSFIVFFFKLVDFSSSFVFQIDFWIILPYLQKQSCWDFYRICVKLVYQFRKKLYLYYFSLWNHEQNILPHLFRSSLISFIRIVWYKHTSPTHVLLDLHLNISFLSDSNNIVGLFGYSLFVASIWANNWFLYVYFVFLQPYWIHLLVQRGIVSWNSLE